MRSLVKVILVLAMLLSGASAMRAQVSVGISIGAPPPPRVVYAERVAPEPGFVWVTGYWYPVGHHYRWHEGYWTRPPYEGAYWVAPRHDGRQYFVGYWAGERGRVEHDHHWDREHDGDRDHDGREVRYREHDHDHNRDRDRDHDHDREHDRD
jgi:hypothetical protein